MLKSTITPEDYADLNNLLEEQNIEYKLLLQSKAYKLGNTLIKISECILKLNFKSMYGYYLKLISQKASSQNMNGSKADLDNNFQKPFSGDYFITERIAVYTAIFGNYDKIQEPLISPNNIDYYIFTNSSLPKNSKWNRINAQFPDGLNNAEKNRYVKMHPNKFFNNYKFSIYVDGSIKVISDLTPFIKRIGNYGIAFYKHSLRNCLFDEMEIAVTTHKVKKTDVQLYRTYLLEHNMPINYGLLECGMIVCENKNETCIAVMDAWWHQYKEYFKRDQVSLPFVLYKHSILIEDICKLGDNIYCQNAIRIYQHGE